MTQAQFDFSGTTTVVTGGASGIGLAIAETIVRAGGSVVISASRNPDKTRSALDRLRAAAPGAQAQSLSCEVGREESVAEFFSGAERSAGNIRYVVHSAAVSPNTEFFEQTQKEWDTVLNTNLTGTFLVLKYAARLLSQNPVVDEWKGKIVLVTSSNGVNAYSPVSAHYDASKAGANLLMRNAAQELASLRICVNALAPGWIETAMNDTLPDDVRAGENAKIWMGRWGTAQEMGRCVAHLLTMPYLVGQVLMPDGGYR
ncbi:MAG TPA: SDR family NAD(P)-dependent oxidoreductase [Burkholderiaceae bacterium]|jgi:3-oxoacyl-[acyl-carrier protein] reductase|nr:SDR family NAD(P)-dependent oxidoreductase [Burkholderiaceae bacterium]